MVTSMVHVLKPVPPYDLAKAWEFMLASEGVAPSPQKRTLIRAWMEGGKAVAVRLEDTGTVNAPELEAELLVGDETAWPRIEATLRRSLSLDVDLAPLLAAARDDEALSRLLAATRGYRMVCLPTPFEAAVWAVLKQNTFQTIARSNWRKLLAAFGESVRVDGRELACFPDPATFLRRASTVKLRALKIRRSHAEYLRNAAEAFKDELSDDETGFLAPDEVRATLRAVPGFGPWSAQFVSMRGFGFHDGYAVVPESIQIRAGKLYGAPLSNREVRDMLRRYEPYSAFVAHLLRAFGPAPDKDPPKPRGHRRIPHAKAYRRRGA